MKRKDEGESMRVIVGADRTAVGDDAALLVMQGMAHTTSGVLGVATGSSPLGVYAALGRAVRAGSVDFSRSRAFALDEYVGLPAGHPESYRSVVQREIVEPLGLSADLVRVPDGTAMNLEGAAAEYERAIETAGGIDVQILGIGTNGHIGFNEPGAPHDSVTRVVALTAATRAANARFFDSVDDVPQLALTQGVATILRARRIVLVALGEGKADAVRRAVEGPVSLDCPASALQNHPDVTLVIDEAAASGLTRLSSAASTSVGK